MSSQRSPERRALAAAVVTLLSLASLAGCGRRSTPAAGAVATPGAMDSSVHVVMDSTSAPEGPDSAAADAHRPTVKRRVPQ